LLSFFRRLVACLSRGDITPAVGAHSYELMCLVVVGNNVHTCHWFQGQATDLLSSCTDCYLSTASQPALFGLFLNVCRPKIIRLVKPATICARTSGIMARPLFRPLIASSLEAHSVLSLLWSGIERLSTQNFLDSSQSANDVHSCHWSYSQATLCRTDCYLSTSSQRCWRSLVWY
jgi:hypothetical protein